MPVTKRKSDEELAEQRTKGPPRKRNKVSPKTRSGLPPKKRGRKKMTSQSHQEADAERARRDPGFALELLVREANEKEYMDNFAEARRQQQQQHEQQQQYQQMQVAPMMNFASTIQPNAMGLEGMGWMPALATNFQPQLRLSLDPALDLQGWNPDISPDSTLGSFGEMNASFPSNYQIPQFDGGSAAPDYGPANPGNALMWQDPGVFLESGTYQQGIDYTLPPTDQNFAWNAELDGTGYNNFDADQYFDPSMLQY